MLTNEEINQLVAIHVYEKKEGIDFGTWPSHEWARDEQGEINLHAWDDGDRFYGPRCVRENCWEMSIVWEWRLHDWEDVPCVISLDNYAGEIGFAWRVFEWVTNRYGITSIEHGMNNHNRFVVTVLDEDLVACVASSELAPRAICLATLLALKVIKVEDLYEGD